MENNYELSDELLDSISGGSGIENLNEEDQSHYEIYVKPMLEILKENLYSLPAEQRHALKNDAAMFVEVYGNSLAGDLTSEALKQFVTSELWKMIIELPAF